MNKFSPKNTIKNLSKAKMISKFLGKRIKDVSYCPEKVV